MAGTPVRVLLARHGETAWNVEGRWQGQADSPLTERGVRQAGSLAAALAGEPVAAVVTSDLPRAARTAEIVAAPHGLAVVADARLRELDVGMWTGKVGADLREQYALEMDTWLRAPAHLGRIPGGESLAEVQARCLACLDERLAAHAGWAVVVITHGAAVQTILAAALGRPLADLWLKEGRIENCQVAHLEWTPGAGLRVVRYGDTRHLEAVGTLRGWRVMDQQERDARATDDPAAADLATGNRPVRDDQPATASRAAAAE